MGIVITLCRCRGTKRCAGRTHCTWENPFPFESWLVQPPTLWGSQNHPCNAPWPTKPMLRVLNRQEPSSLWQSSNRKCSAAPVSLDCDLLLDPAAREDRTELRRPGRAAVGTGVQGPKTSTACLWSVKQTLSDMQPRASSATWALRSARWCVWPDGPWTPSSWLALPSTAQCHTGVPHELS